MILFRFEKYPSGDDFFAVNPKSILLFCIDQGRRVGQCGGLVNPTFTDLGICYTYNGKTFQEGLNSNLPYNQAISKIL